MNKPGRWAAILVSLVALGTVATSAFAASTVVVTPANQQGWSTADTRPGGAVNFITDATSPYPTGALQLTTDATITSKAQYLHAANVPLTPSIPLSYYTKQVSALFPQGDPSYQLPVNLNGATGFTTFVFEPYENLGNNGNAAVIPNAWQKWNVTAGLFWSSRSVTCVDSHGTPTGAVVAGSGGAPFYTLTQIHALCPQAIIIGFGVNIGSNNPGYNVETDGVNFNGTTYDFQVTNVPTDEDQCKHGGYVNYTDASGHAFANQGACVSYVNHHNGHGDDGHGDGGHGDGGHNDGEHGDNGNQGHGDN